MTTPTVTKNQDVTLTITSPSLTLNGTTSVKTPASPSNQSHWTISLTRNVDTLIVGVLWYRHPSYSCSPEPNMYGAMHLVPHNNPTQFTTTIVSASSLLGQSTVLGTIDVNKVLYNNTYCFDIVMSTSAILSRMPVETNNKRGDLMLILLKDIHSVDTCFVFESDKSYANVGLWAHRTVLSTYKPFANLIKQTSSESVLSSSSSSSEGTKKSESSLADAPVDPQIKIDDDQSVPTASGCRNGVSNLSNNSSVLTISIEKFSLATFCVLLRYIYTGEIDLSADIGLHAVSVAETSLVVQGIAGKKQELVHWNPLDLTSPWKFKDVTWEELLLAADFFGVADLRARCEEAMVGTMSASKAVKILFGVGSCFDKVKEEAMNYIVTNMESIMKEGKDKTFAPYKDHPYCFDVMFELMERRAAKDKV
ncbi:hypothetical protein EDD21DRAFT_376070 [Dissophora ornata]|nr:hypothetical protein BGZ58_010591 [Dissophora ornata]KAI8600841.1 hypothetical protein EDD21DRAFT_376070 [Dissophora ornata]